jgi:hypothetical protein
MPSCRAVQSVIPSQFLTMSPKISLERVLLEILIPAALQRSLCIGFERHLATALIIAEGEGHPSIVPTEMIAPGGRPR